MPNRLLPVNLFNQVIGKLGLIHGGANADLSATGPGLVVQNANAANLSVLTNIGDFCGGRLTLLSGTPLPTTDQTAKTTIYFTPFVHSLISLYDGSHGWVQRTFSEVSVAVPSTIYKLFDIFGYDNSGTLALETTDWNQTTGSITGATNAAPVVLTTANSLSVGDIVGVTGMVGLTSPNGFVWRVSARDATHITLEGSTGNGVWSSGGTWYQMNATRATALTTQDNVLVKTGATTRRYLGTACTTSTSGQCEDSARRRMFWNYYNRRCRQLLQGCSGSGYTYNTLAYRLINADPANMLEIVTGVAEDIVHAQCSGYFIASAADGVNIAIIGLGLDQSVNGTSGVSMSGDPGVAGAANYLSQIYDAMPTAGYHFISGIQRGSSIGTNTWYTQGGDRGLGGFIYG